jgi:GDPmannose 4,6-dehydratase
VRDFVKLSFAETGIELEFSGDGTKETGAVKSCSNPAYQLPVGKIVVAVDPEYFRPTEVELLIGMLPKQNKIRLDTKIRFGCPGKRNDGK